MFTEGDDGGLHCDGVPLARIAAEVGTPTYVYSLHDLRAAYRAYDEALRPVPHLVCYAIKANDTLAVPAPWERLVRADPAARLVYDFDGFYVVKLPAGVRS